MKTANLSLCVSLIVLKLKAALHQYNLLHFSSAIKFSNFSCKKSFIITCDLKWANKSADFLANAKTLEAVYATNKWAGFKRRTKNI